MGRKGHKTTSDYLPLEEYERLITCLENDKDPRIRKNAQTWIFFLRISFYTALRGSDTLSLKWSEILNTDKIKKVEMKTGKERIIAINKEKRDRIKTFYKYRGEPNPDSYVFTSSRKNRKPYGIDYMNRQFKKWKRRYQLKVGNFSTHSMRKLFGRHYWEHSKKNEAALMFLCDIYQHSEVKTTKIYLGIRQEEINAVYHAIPA